MEIDRDAKGRFIKGHSIDYQKCVESGFKKGNIPWNKDSKMSEEYCDNRTAEFNPNWKGGTYKKEGYVFIRQPNHPKATQRGYIAEHILVVEKCLGRYLDNGEIVHHVNGKVNDNRIENLEVMRKPEHYWWHQNMIYYKRVFNDYLTSVN